MPTQHALDRPVWSALNANWASVSVGDRHALRLQSDYGPFAAARDASAASLAALTMLAPAGEDIWLVEANALAVPSGLVVKREAVLHQLVAQAVTPPRISVDLLCLGDDDAGEMLALARLTVPGPFAARTHRLGRFIGIKQHGRLVAMAGERMRFDGYAEVSGVCTHPDFRGLGYAATLIQAVARNMLKRGETPFLHSYARNSAAIALYEAIGFRLRSPIHMAVIGL